MGPVMRILVGSSCVIVTLCAVTLTVHHIKTSRWQHVESTAFLDTWTGRVCFVSSTSARCWANSLASLEGR